MRISLDGEVRYLPPLTDQEYTQVEQAARRSGGSLHICPTCGGRDSDTGVAGIKVFTSRTYRYMGEEHECDCQTQMALWARYLLANIGEQYMRLDWSRDFRGTTAASEHVDLYLDKWKSFKRHGWGLEFGGPLGVGKTFAATHIGKELIKHQQRVYFLPFVEMVSAFEKENSNDLEHLMRETNYLILDEILPSVSERQHSFYATRFEALIRHRTNHNLPTIITTNLAEEKLEKEYPRTYSLLAAKQVRVDMSGEDARKMDIGRENLEMIINDECRPIT